MNNNQMHPQMQQIYQMQNQMFNNQQQPNNQMNMAKNSLQGKKAYITLRSLYLRNDAKESQPY